MPLKISHPQPLVLTLPAVPDVYRQAWQKALATLAEFLGVAATLLAHSRDDKMEGFLLHAKSGIRIEESAVLPILSGLRGGSDSDQETAILIPNSDGLAAVAGRRVRWQSGNAFGMLCVLDTIERTLTKVERNLVQLVAEKIERDVAEISEKQMLRFPSWNEQLPTVEPKEQSDLSYHINTVVAELGDRFVTFRYNPQAILLSLSTSAQTLFEKPLEQLLGASILTAVHWTPETMEFMPQKISALFEIESVRGYEVSFSTSDGTVKTLSLNAHSVKDDHGIPQYIEGIFEDISARKRLEHELVESQDRFRRLVEGLGETFVVYQHDVKGEFLSVSPASATVFGILPEECIGKNLSEIIDWTPETRRTMFRSARSYTDSSPIHTLEGRYYAADGTLKTLSNTAHPVFNDQGDILYIEGICENITARKHTETALRNSERFLQQVQRSARIGHWVLDIQTKALEFSDEMYSICGAEAGTRIRTLADSLPFIHPEDVDALLASIDHAVENRSDYQMDCRIVRSDHEIRQVAVRGELICDAIGAPFQIIGTMQDTTELVHMAEKLRSSQERFDLAINATKEGIFDFDYEQGTVFYSQQWKRQIGYKENELPNTFDTWTAQIHPDDRARVIEIVEKAKQSKNAHFEIEYRMLDKEGRTLDLCSRAMIVRNQAGKVIRITGTNQNITELRELEDTLKVYKQFADSSPQAFGMATPDTNFAYVNDAFVALLGGKSPGDIVGKSFLEFYPEELQHSMKTEVVNQLMDEGTWSGELRVRTLQEEEIPTIENFFLIRDNKGEPLYISNATTPIAQMKEKEKYLENARAAAELANKTKGEFLANMSHEIRTPMNAIIGMSHLVLNTAMTPKQRNYLLKIDNAAKMLLRIINDVLDYSKIEAGKMELEHRAFDIEETAVQCLDFVSNTAAEKGIELLADFDPELPGMVLGDALRIGQILNNLLQNAVKFTTTGKVILTIRPTVTTPSNIVVSFSVADTGIGIPSDQQQQLFTMFTQADGSITRKFGGTGLGLSICKKLVELMDGTIGVESEPGRGSVFTFEIPLTVNPDAALKKIIPRSEPALHGKSVLIIDDNTDAREIFRKLLEHQSLQIHTLSSTDEYGKPVDLSRAFQGHELVIIDSAVNGASGSSILKEFPTLMQPNIPALLIASRALRGRVHSDAQAAGFTGVLEKPFRPSQVIATIQRALMAKDAVPVAPEPHYVARKHGRLGQTTVLVVEDNDINQEVAIELLELAGLSVVAAGNGVEAIRMVQEEKFDLVFMDIQMPEMDGLTATARIRELPECGRDQLPILAMTAHAMAGDAERCIAAGMNGYLSKPIDPNELHIALRQWLPESVETAKANLQRKNIDTDAVWVRVLEEHGIQASDALKVIQGNEVFFHKMLSKFSNEYIESPNKIRTWLVENDFESAHLLAHSIKSVAGYIGAKTLWAHTAELERAIKEKSDNWSTALEVFEESIIDTVNIIRMAGVATAP